MKHTLYCEYDFFINFFDNRPKIDAGDPFSEDKKNEIWKKYCSLFFQGSNIHLNISGDEFYNKPSNKFIDMLKKKKTEGGIKIKFDKFPDDFDNINEKHALFFLCDLALCNQKEGDNGMLFFSNSNIFQKANCIFPNDCFYRIDKTIPDWQFLAKHKHPCNFILIIDKFIFKKIAVSEKNLTSLFNVLLPDKIKKTFHVIIRTKKPTNTDTNWDDWKGIIDCGNWEEKIKGYFLTIIRNIRKEQDFPVQIIFEEIKYSEHDRNLITNYYWISSGYGFVLSDDEKLKGTDLHVHNISQINVLKRINEFRQATIF